MRQFASIYIIIAVYNTLGIMNRPALTLGAAFALAFIAVPCLAEKPSVPNTEEDCAAIGGNWTTLGLPYPGKPKVCDVKAKDSGKVCTGSDQCEGICLAEKGVAVGSDAHGVCSAYLNEWGCYLRVEHGRVEKLCAD
ncbi:hypothetical protein AZKH_p0121 (plasmid) [Azoarcus sp. KH32C]|nr:hypothetical protein AZKH_p0121 [Azoarcus sp. KH32C]